MRLSVVRGWVWLYTLGLPLEMRNARRAEIASDLWDQTNALGVHGPGATGDKSSILLRCLRGIPADLLWRFVEARIQSSFTKERPMTQMFGVRSSLGLATMILMAMLVVASIVLIAVHTIEYDDPSRRLIVPWLKYVIGFSLLFLGFALSVVGFGLIQRAPGLGAVLAIGGIWMVAVLFYWMWYPVSLFLAAGVSVFAVGWARRRTQIDTGQEPKSE